MRDNCRQFILSNIVIPESIHNVAVQMSSAAESVLLFDESEWSTGLSVDLSVSIQINLTWLKVSKFKIQD